MPNVKTNKKRVVVKLQNMPEELQEEVRKQYPYGFTDHMMRIDKGPGDFFYASYSRRKIRITSSR